MNTQFETYIREYKIFGLHGDKDVELVFDSPYKIIVAENGTGKTTVLNSLFYWLTGQYQKLSRITFEKLELSFCNNEKIELSRSDLYSETPHNVESVSDYVRLRRKRYMDDLFKDLFNLQTSSPRDIRSKSQYSGEEISNSSLLDQNQKIKNLLPLEVFYLPTYRRVEEDLQRLGYEGELIDNQEQLIHFGMQDVSKRFKKITSDITESAVTWYSKISGEMLDELVGGVLVSKEQVPIHHINPDIDTLKIVLDRIGDNISKDKKNDIIRLIHSADIYKEEHKFLAYFLSKLAEIYDKQRDKDKKIKDFVKTASKYLVDKELIYDESNVTITIVNTRTGKEITLEKLSSGEKQLISILSKLYLESDKPNFIIFDEPELSLSIEWQRDILPDIIASGQCKLLLAATHSPFIFENDLDVYAEALKISYREMVSD